jgi:protein-L-isoaspartate(D-aspartate) O-methyltransferase
MAGIRGCRGVSTLGAVLGAALWAVAGAAGSQEPGQDDGAQELRDEMVAEIRAHAEETGYLFGEGGLSPAVLEVMRTVPRHRFVPERERHLAHADRPVPIGWGQTISQPFIVAAMTDLLEPEPGDVVLEIGTGSGYQAAVLSPLVARVCTVEIIPELGERAAAVLAEEARGNVEVRVADGYGGWPECGPFDGVVVTAAIEHVPPPLVAQLKPGGRMVIPVGGPFSLQMLTVVEKSAAGEVSARQLMPVRFVPFTRAPG